MSFCPQAVIFDMDGLLVDSEPVWAIAESAMMAARGKQSDPEIQHTLIGLRMRDFLSGMRRAYDMTDSSRRPLRRYRRAHDRADPGAVSAAPRRARTARLSVRARHPLCDCLQFADGDHRRDGGGAGLGPLLSDVHVSGDDVPHGKPAPDIYLEAARRLASIRRTALRWKTAPTGRGRRSRRG